jgi:hypothetical protein
MWIFHGDVPNLIPISYIHYFVFIESIDVIKMKIY